MPPTIRGPLPPAVYWRRRAVVVGGALLLLVLLVRIVHHGGGGQAAGSNADDTARRTSSQSSGQSSGQTSGQTSGQPSGQPSSSDPSAGPTSGAPLTTTRRHHRGTGTTGDPSSAATTGPVQGPTQPVLAAPTGTCKDNDVRIVPASVTGTAGSPVSLALGLQTRTEAACTWHVSYRSLALTVVHHGEIVWSSGQCPQQLPDATVVVRQAVSTPITVTWDGHTSESGCPRDTAYAPAGGYRVSSAAIGGLPASAKIVLRDPTIAASDTPSPADSPSSSPSDSPSSSPSSSPSAGTGRTGHRSPTAPASAVPTKRHRTMPVR